MTVKQLNKQETSGTAQESFSDSDILTDDSVIIYSEEELTAMREVRAKLLKDHGIKESQIGSIFLAVATINCKLRVDESVKKITKMLEIMELLGCSDGIDNNLWKTEAKHELSPYLPTGRDHRGCSITWIRGSGGVSKEDERYHCQACIMQYLAVHADAKTLRQGVSFIVDMSNKQSSKVGNEKLIQSFYQSIPQRPQIILIAGAGYIMRTVVNASIKLASVFTKQKILQRIHFTSIEEAKRMFPQDSAPTIAGGKGGGIESYEDWVKERLSKLPAPDLSDSNVSEDTPKSISNDDANTAVKEDILNLESTSSADFTAGCQHGACVDDDDTGVGKLFSKLGFTSADREKSPPKEEFVVISEVQCS